LRNYELKEVLKTHGTDRLSGPVAGLVFLSAFEEFHHLQGARVADLLAQGQLVHGRNMGAGGGAQGVRVGADFFSINGSDVLSSAGVYCRVRASMN